MHGEFEAARRFVNCGFEDARIVGSDTQPNVLRVNSSDEGVGVKVRLDFGHKAAPVFTLFKLGLVGRWASPDLKSVVESMALGTSTPPRPA